MIAVTIAIPPPNSDPEESAKLDYMLRCSVDRCMYWTGLPVYVIREPYDGRETPTPHFAKLDIFDKFADELDADGQILYFDADAFFLSTPDFSLFQDHPDRFYCVGDRPSTETLAAAVALDGRTTYDLSKRYFNGGFFVASHQYHSAFFSEVRERALKLYASSTTPLARHFAEQTTFNYVRRFRNVPTCWLPYIWNHVAYRPQENLKKETILAHMNGLLNCRLDVIQRSLANLD